MAAAFWTTDTNLVIMTTAGAGLIGTIQLEGPLVGRSVHQWLGNANPAAPLILAHRRALAGELAICELPWEGQTFQCVVEPLRDSEGRIAGAIGLAHNRNRIWLSAIQEEFNTTSVRDLRTPLTTLRAGIDFLAASASTRLDERENVLLLRLARNVARLNWEIENILIFNQFAAGALHLDRYPLNLHVTVGMAQGLARPLLVEREQQIVVQQDGPWPITGDQRRLAQAMGNLIEYAGRCLPAGSTIVIAGRLRDDRLIVLGSAKAIAPELWDDEPTADDSLTTGDDSGLGLIIARIVVELHGGKLWINRTRDDQQSLVFHVVLPAQADH